jgi:hypothetical protein
VTLRRIRLTDHRGRSSTVALVSVRAPGSDIRRLRDPRGGPVRFKRVVRADECTRYATLERRFSDPDALARALVEGDPEADPEIIGCETGPCDRVLVGEDSRPLYAARLVEVRLDSHGRVVDRYDPVDVPANSDQALWSGKLMAPEEAARRFAFTRIYQVRHTDGLQRDFLFDMAQYLHQRNRMALIGTGAQGTDPLILERNGIPMHGFLLGQTRESSYRLVLYLAAFELKPPEGGR